MQRAERRFFFIVGGLTLLGVGLLVGEYYWHMPAVFAALGEAALIAGVLAFTVDRYVKERLLREVSNDAAKYLIGYGLAPALQDAIRERMETKVLRTRYVHRYVITEIAGTDRVRVEQHVTYDLENWSPAGQEYTPMVGLERHDRPVFQEISCISSEQDATFSCVPPEANERPHDPGSMEARGNRIMVQPRSSGVTYRVVKRFTLTMPQEGSDVASFIAPTHHVTVEVAAPDNYEVVVAPPTDMRAGTTWEYPALFLRGQHVRIRWFKRETAPKTADQSQARTSHE